MMKSTRSEIELTRKNKELHKREDELQKRELVLHNDQVELHKLQIEVRRSRTLLSVYWGFVIVLLNSLIGCKYFAMWFLFVFNWLECMVIVKTKQLYCG